MRRLGVITGLQSEVRCLVRCLARFPLDQHPQIRCAGANAIRAGEAARDLIAQGCDALVSFGVAGGLTPGLGPGVLVIPPVIIAPDGRRFDTDADWRARLGALAIQGMDVRLGDLAGSDGSVATADDKRRLRDAVGAVAVDMESHQVAEAATGAGIPFMVLRAIADPWNRALPAWAGKAVAADGSLRIGAIALEVIKDYGELPELIGMGLANRRAMATLRRVATIAGPRLGLGSKLGPGLSKTLG